MALVPYNTRGPAADQTARERLFQVAGLPLTIRQHPAAGMRTLEGIGSGSLAQVELEAADPSATAAGRSHGAAAGDTVPRGPSPLDPLGSVGLVAWQCGFVLADLLLRRPPLGSWHGLRVVDLGCGTGLVGIALAVAGASVTLTDVPHVLPLTLDNVRANCDRHAVAVRPEVKEHVWGDAGSAAELCPQPDVITAADVLYDPKYYDDLLCSLELLCAPHTLVYIAWKKRHVEEEGFQALAESRGFAVEQVPVEHLAEEYRDGTYAVLRLCRFEPMDVEP